MCNITQKYLENKYHEYYTANFSWLAVQIHEKKIDNPIEFYSQIIESLLDMHNKFQYDKCFVIYIVQTYRVSELLEWLSGR